MATNAHDMVVALMEAAGEHFPRIRTKTFREDGVLTSDAGFVARLPDGSEFQITIVQSKGAR